VCVCVYYAFMYVNVFMSVATKLFHNFYQM